VVAVLALTAATGASAQMLGNYPIIIVPPASVQKPISPKPTPDAARANKGDAPTDPPATTGQRYHGRTPDLDRF
jgi:hypothetical protein